MNAGSLVTLCDGVIEHSPLALAITQGESHRQRAVNAAFCRLTCTAPESLLDRPFAESFPDSARDGTLALLDYVWRTGRAARRARLPSRMGTGGVAYWNVAAWPVMEDGARTDAVMLHLERVGRGNTPGAEPERRAHRFPAPATPRPAVEPRNRRDGEPSGSARVRLDPDHVLAGVSDGVVVLDATGRVVLANDAARELLGVEVGGRLDGAAAQVSFALHRIDGKPIEEANLPVKRVLAGERFEEAELVLRRVGAVPRVVNVSGRPLASSDAGAAVLVIRDVSELYHLQHTRDQTASLISHDLRAPLTSILAYAELIESGFGGNDPRLLRMASAIARSARQMNVMIDELRDTARLEAGRIELVRLPVDMTSLVREAVESAVSPATHERVHVHVLRRVPVVAVDRDRMQRVIANLLTNALKYSPADSPVEIYVDGNDEEVVVSVTDHGVGIPADEMPRLFQRYVRVPTGARVEGLGLGLYIARLIVEAHGGRIWAESQHGAGRTFRFALPVRNVPPARGAIPGREAETG